MKTKTLVAFLGGLVFLYFTKVQDDGNKKFNINEFTVPQIAGKTLFKLKKCDQCHTLKDKPKGKRTSLNSIREESWFAGHVQKESKIVLRMEKSRRKQKRVLKEEILALKEYLFQIGAKKRHFIDSLPKKILRGAYLVYQNKCLKCHSIAGFGKDVGPDLTHIGRKHDKAWFIANLKNPQQFAPESVMPKFSNLPEDDLEKIAEYLYSLK